jgi:hypothetical protein
MQGSFCTSGKENASLPGNQTPADPGGPKVAKRLFLAGCNPDPNQPAVNEAGATFDNSFFDN